MLIWYRLVFSNQPDDFLKGSNYIPFYQFSSRKGVRCPHHSANSQLADFIRVQCYFVYF